MISNRLSKRILGYAIGIPMGNGGSTAKYLLARTSSGNIAVAQYRGCPISRLPNIAVAQYRIAYYRVASLYQGQPQGLPLRVSPKMGKKNLCLEHI
jgi:hypothetical protein